MTLIKREDAIKELDKEYRCTDKSDDWDGLETAIKIIDTLPSAEAVHGEWGHMIADGEDGSHWYEYECSHCGEVVLRPYNYCPNCGARMFREDGEA